MFDKPIIPFGAVNRIVLLINIFVSFIYLSWWFSPSNISNPLLYWLLFFGEIYHLTMAFTFWHTIWPTNSLVTSKYREHYQPSIDIFIPVTGEPVEVVCETVQAAKNLNYPNKKIFILNDGFVAKKENWQEIIDLAISLEVCCFTRKIPGGAKAGNINNALKKTTGELIVLFDADMVPHKDFLTKTVFYFQDQKVGFIQTPQYYKNYHENLITNAAWDQQKLFFGPILRGKENSNAAFVCGTNVVLRRSTLLEVGGMVENNIAEDFLTSLRIHQNGWVSHYVPEVLSEGLAPQDLLSYYKQQFRWSRGSLEVLFSHNPLFSRSLRLNQKIEYLSSALFYLNGLIILIDLMMPLLYLLWGLQPVNVSTASFAVYFIPFMFLNLYTLNKASSSDISFNTFSFTYSLWYLQLTALISMLLHQTVRFNVTPKTAQQGIYPYLSIPHLIYVLLTFIGTVIGLNRQGLDSSIATNMSWAIFNIILFIPFIYASFRGNKSKDSTTNIVLSKVVES